LVALNLPRTVDSEVTLTATRAGVRLVVEHAVTLQASDPLIGKIRSGDVTGSDLTYYLFGGSDYEYQGVKLTLKSNSMLPILEFTPEQSTAIVRFGFVAEGDAPVRFEEIEQSENIDYRIILEDIGEAPDSAALASRRTWTVHADGFRIVGVEGQPASQDSNTIVFQGPPGETVVAFQRNLETISPPVTSPVEEQSFTNDTPSIALGPFGRLAYLVTDGWLAWSLTLLLPWFVMLFGEGGTTNPASAQARRVALVIVISFPVVGVAMHYASARADAISTVELMMVAPAVVATTVLHVGRRPWTRRLLVVQSVTAIAAVTIGLAFALESGDTVNYRTLVAALVIGGCAVAGLVGLLFGRRYAFAGASLGVAVVSAAIAGTQLDAVKTYALERPLVGLLILAGLGLLAANATTALVQLWQPTRSALWVAISLVAGTLLFLPIVRLLHDPAYGANIAGLWIYYYQLSVAAPMLMTVLNVLLGIIALTVLRGYGHDTTALQEPLVWTLGVATVLCLTYDSKPFSWADLLSGVAVWIALWWLLPLDRRDEAARLGAVTVGAHTRLIRAETRRRIAQLGAHDLYRRARFRLAAEEIKLNDYNRRQRILDNAASSNGKRIEDIPLECALGTSAGCTPWQNAVASVGFALPIAGLIIAYEMWTFVENNEAVNWFSPNNDVTNWFSDTVTVLDAARHLVLQR